MSHIIVPGLRVFVFVKRWRVGTVRRVITPNPNLVRIGAPRGPRASVEVDSLLGKRSVRLVSELIPVRAFEDHPAMITHKTRADAVAYAIKWWTERNLLTV